MSNYDMTELNLRFNFVGEEFESLKSEFENNENKNAKFVFAKDCESVKIPKNSTRPTLNVVLSNNCDIESLFEKTEDRVMLVCVKCSGENSQNKEREKEFSEFCDTVSREGKDNAKVIKIDFEDVVPFCNYLLNITSDCIVGIELNDYDITFSGNNLLRFSTSKDKDLRASLEKMEKKLAKTFKTTKGESAIIFLSLPNSMKLEDAELITERIKKYFKDDACTLWCLNVNPKNTYDISAIYF